MLQRLVTLLLVTAAALYSVGARAAVSSSNILSNVTDQFHAQAASWGGIITGYATNLFWTLGTISLVFTGVTLILKKADIGEFFAEFIRFILFFGFFLWLLQNAAAIGSAILHSLMIIGANASQTGVANPSAVMDIGFNIFHKVMEQTSIWSPVDSMIGMFLAAIVLVCIALIAANMTIMLCSAWILLYGGIFFLGFDGSRWTSDIAINYYKAILGVAASLMAMVLMVGIAQSIITSYYNQMSTGIDINEIATIMVVAVILLLLVHRVPGLISGILTGASISHSGIGSWSAGHAMGAMGVAATAAITTGAVASTAARHIGSGGVAMMAALQAAQQAMAEGNAQPATRGGLHEAMGSGNGFMSTAGGAQPANGKGASPIQSASSHPPNMPNSISVVGDTPDDEIAAFVHKP
jgi:P-type conjugative transfer protein TrbL